MGGTGLWQFFIVFLIQEIIFGIPAYKIVKKAGYNGAWHLVLLVPLVGLVMVWVFAFSRWRVSPMAA